MGPDQLSAALRMPELHQRLLGDYRGAYSLGIGRDPEDPAAAAVVLHVEGDQPLDFPSFLQIGSERIRVITRRGFVLPRPLEL
jgi:hypothetical protein